MLKRKLILLPILLLSLVIIFSCQNQPIGLSPDSQGQTPVMSQIVLPEGANITSATFHIYVYHASGQTVYVHRVTAAWDEATVCWNSFGGAYASPALTSFVTDQGPGWYEFDLTSLVHDYVNEVYDNYGILLNQSPMDMYQYNGYYSKDNLTLQPWIEICYEDNGGTECEQDIVMQDAFIWELWPGSNYGFWNFLMTGWIAPTELEKQSLLQFELEFTPPEEGCSRTIGYWKTHAGFGPQADDVTPLLPIWLGTSGGAKSLEVTTAAMAVDILELKTYCDADNMITKLYAQLLGVKLNLASGASDAAVSDAIIAADLFLADHDCTDWEGLSEEDQEMVEGWKDMFDDYNNGDIGPGHCEDVEEDDMVMAD
jgi:hypothetical protein